MSSRPRKDGPVAASSEETSLWHSARTHLRTLERVRSALRQQETEISVLRSQIAPLEERLDLSDANAAVDEDLSSIEEEYQKKSRAIEDIYLNAKGRNTEEVIAIDGALEKLGILTAIMSAPEVSSAPDPKRKKRRTDTGIGSPTPSRSPSAQPPPLPRVNSTQRTTNEAPGVVAPEAAERSSTPGTKKGAAGPKSGAAATVKVDKIGTSTAGTLSRRNTGNTQVHMDPAKARREVLFNQLPLQKGRKVAFRQPAQRKLSNGGPTGSKAPGSSMQDDDGETWIMATVIECINNDRNRYVVQDAEDDSTTGVPATWKTTLKTMVPLPESIATLPPHDYPVGSQVLGLYPDTSCFYRATVHGGGPGIDRMAPMKLAKKEQEILKIPYQLEFEDDGGDIKAVPASLVVTPPGSVTV